MLAVIPNLMQQCIISMACDLGLALRFPTTVFEANNRSMLCLDGSYVCFGVFLCCCYLNVCFLMGSLVAFVFT